MRLFEHLLAPSLRTADEETKRRARLLVLVTLLLLFPNIAFISMYVATAQLGMMWPALFITAALTLALVRVRLRADLFLATHLVCGSYVLVVFHYSFATGGLYQGALWTFSIIAVMLAFLLGGKRTGLIWAFAHGTAIAIHLGLICLGFRFPVPPPHADVITPVLSVVTLTVVLLGISIAYENTKERMRVAVEEQRNHARLVLDTIGEGYVLADANGIVTGERSKAVENVFGVPLPHTAIWDYIGGSPPERDDLELAWNALVADVMPREVLLYQMPRQRRIGPLTYSLTYRPVVDAQGRITRIVVLIADITAELAANRVREERLEHADLLHRAVKDPTGFLAFFREANALVEEMRTTNQVAAARALHTLKGTASVFGALRLASSCHRLEDKLADGMPLSEHACNEIAEDIESLGSYFEPFVRERAEALETARRGLTEIRRLTAGLPCERAVWEISEQWMRSSVERDAERLAEKTKALAKRLQKGDIDVRVEAARIDLPDGALDRLWSSLTHVVRNAIDHGLESPDEREAAGKTRYGVITFRVEQHEDDLLVSVRDDGRGVDWDRIRDKARASGMRCETSDDLVAAMFSDGLSTRDEATLESGRGVGMGAVLEAARSLGGSVSVTSERGEGTTVCVTVPIASATHESIREIAAA